MKHKEAFCLMWYACGCGHRERMWNSRDGVTPFCAMCPSCGNATMTHVQWGLDGFLPNHKPHSGQRIWRDGTPEEAMVLIQRRVEAIRSHGISVSEEDIQDAIKHDFPPGWPKLEVTP